MRWLPLVILLVVSFPAAAMVRGGSASSSNCPVGSPSPDGSIIFAPGPSCLLRDHEGTTWQYNGSDLALMNGSPQGAPSIEIAILHSGYAFQLKMPSGCPYQLWTAKQIGDSFAQTNGTTSSSPLTLVTNTRTGLSYGGILGAMGSAQAGDTLNFAAPPSGIPISLGVGRVTLSNITITGAAGAVVGCSQDEGNAAIPVDTGGGAVSNLTINTLEVAYVRDTGTGSFRGINIGTAVGATLNGVNVHDNDMGIIGSGNNGTVTIENSTFDHNGSGWSASATHNVYLGGHTNTTNWNVKVSNTRSYCTHAGGYPFKTRAPRGIFTAVTFADPDGTHSDCNESAALDISCGGDYTVGGVSPGQGAVLELGPKASNMTLIRYGDDENGSGANCVVGGWSVNKLLIQNAWLILDAPEKPIVGCFNSPACQMRHDSWTFTIRNSKIVCNGAQTCDAVHVLGPGVTDGGGNTFYANRAAARLGTFPMLPKPP